MRVLVASRDVRVRRALSSLLESDGDRIVGATEAATLLLDLDAELHPDLVLLELDRHENAQDVTVVEALARRGRAVIAVSGGPASGAAVLAAGARACLDKDADFPDRLAQALRALDGPWTSAPHP